MSATAETLAFTERVQLALRLIQTALQLTAFEYPPNCSPASGSYSDYIIVGGGTAGSVIANRLSADSGRSVTVLEAGGYPPIESEIPLAFEYLADSVYSYNFTAVDDGLTGQNLRNRRTNLALGKMLGGTSSLSYLAYRQGDFYDFQEWARLTGDPALNYTNILEYYRRAERVLDQDILNSPYAYYHGFDGFFELTREPNRQNINYFSALRQLGNQIRLDLSGPSSLGFSDVLLTIADGIALNTGLAYLGGAVRFRPNLCVSLYSTATRILITNGVATGVEYVNPTGYKKVLYANKEVIISAGTVNSAKLLLLSGIGRRRQLENFGIKVVADLPVGENYHDHPLAVLVYRMQAGTGRVPILNPYTFPILAHVGAVNLEYREGPPDYEVLGWTFPPNSIDQNQLLSIRYRYSNAVSDIFYAASSGRSTYVVPVMVAKPKSRGRVTLRSANYRDDPIIYTNILSNRSDLQTLARSLRDFNRVLQTRFFKSVNASLVDVGACSPSRRDYWECYALALSTVNGDAVGTCAIGSVVDSRLRVYGVRGLRVADASVMPTITGSIVLGTVIMLGELASDFILYG